MIKNNSVFPEHTVLGPNGKPNKSLTDMVRSQVCEELKIVYHAWQFGWRDTDQNKINVVLEDRIKALYDSLPKELQQEVDANTARMISHHTNSLKNNKEEKPASSKKPALSLLDNMTFDMMLKDCKLVAVQPNTLSNQRTCMYFPWEANQKTGKYPGSLLDIEETLELMKTTGGGWRTRVHEYEGTDRNYYKGWSNCRICDCRNGSSELTINNTLVPEGAMHYNIKHKLPLNLFSIVCGKDRIYYIAKKPYKRIKDL